MQIEELNNFVILFDTYGKLLSKKQYELFSEFINFNLSETELAETFGATRQAVHDAISKAKKQLLEFEEKCGIVENKLLQKQKIEKLKQFTDENVEANRLIDDIIENL